ncbi:MAG: HTH-type transcriptional regulator IscR [Elusimicrobia bacterium]|nr:HTH-type transcriptional regulator IscR [Elusimicrobiota bacterium]
MMKVSTKSTYAIRALIQLAREGGAVPVPLSNIADRQHIPLPFLEQIFSKLRRAGLVFSLRGPQGGYKLAKEPNKISLHEIISHLEGPIDPVLCTMPENRTPTCHEVEGCLSRFLCNELDGELSRVLSKNTLDTFVGQAERMHH